MILIIPDDDSLARVKTGKYSFFRKNDWFSKTNKTGPVPSYEQKGSKTMDRQKSKLLTWSIRWKWLSQTFDEFFRET